MWLSALFITAILRICLPPLLTVGNPYLITTAFLMLDNCDGYIAYRAKWKYPMYHLYDKLIDYWSYIWMVIYTAATPIGEIMAILFVFRTIGQIATFITGNPITLVWFPNLLENYFILYLISQIIPGASIWFEGSNQVTPLLIATCIALIREYIIHIKKYNIGNKMLHSAMDWRKNN